MQTLIGIFSNRAEANSAILELENRGYNPKDISIIVRDGIERRVGTKGGKVTSTAVSGATAGGVIGGLTGLLIGMGAITIPGIGALFIGGPIAAALGFTGAAATAVSGATTGILAGGLVGALAGLGLPEEVAKVYEQRIREGAVLLAVSTQNTQQAEEVRDVFDQRGADQIRAVAQA
ncbi:MAG: hypothetical protein HYT08_03280 [Candidatus Levybacteria bacterium]|nr:hypothetical protein [Candidatus Levybacteria bacterium]